MEGLISEEIARLVSAPVTEKELERVRTAIRRGARGPRESVLSTAISLADDTALYNDPNRINTEHEKRLAVTAADIQKAAKAYLTDCQPRSGRDQPAPRRAAARRPPKQN